MYELKFVQLVVVVILPLNYSAAMFSRVPDNLTQAEGLDAEFYCQHSTAEYVAWLVNGVRVDHLLDRWITFSSTYTSGGTLHTLIIRAIAEYNGTVVQCSAILPSGADRRLMSSNVTLIIQGPLDGVTNLTSTSTNDSIMISWDPPFSLDLTTADPDIAYCVDVFNITSDGQREMIASDCSVLQPQYIFTVDSPDPSDLFEFTVTPRSNVEGAKNETTGESIEGYFLGIDYNVVTEYGYREERTVHTSAEVIVTKLTTLKQVSEPTLQISTFVNPNGGGDNTYVIIVAVLSSTCLVFVAGGSLTVVLLIVNCTLKNNKEGKQHSNEIKLEKCDAYKTVVTKNHKVVINENPAYQGSPIYEELDLSKSLTVGNNAPVIYDRVKTDPDQATLHGNTSYGVL